MNTIFKEYITKLTVVVVVDGDIVDVEAFVSFCEASKSGENNNANNGSLIL